MTPQPFGTLSDGRAVRRATLGGGEGIGVEVLDYGAVVHRLTVPTAAGRVDALTGFPDLGGYEADRGYHGALIGRCANRIGDARFTLDGVESRVSANEGANCLHGGTVGWNKRLWTVEAAGEAAFTLAYESPDGEQGFPGAVSARAAFSLADAWTLVIAYEATCDRPTPVNLTHHLYFDLAGAPLFTPESAGSGRGINDHELTIAADAVTAVRPDLIPTGALTPVEATPFDFRTPRAIGARLGDPHPQLRIPGGYDHNWALTPGAAPAVRLRSPVSGIVLEIETDQPGLQVFGGQSMGPPFRPFSAVALEPQGWPDAVNHPDFPDVVLRPGRTYRRQVTYRFRAGAPG